MISKPGRNDPCHCGSGKKFKQCCKDKQNSTIQNEINTKSSLTDRMHQLMQGAWAYKNKGDFAQAELACHQIIQVQPNHADALNLLGVLMLQDGRVDIATEYFKKAVHIKNKNPEFFSNLGLAFHEQGLLAEAERNYRKAISIDPDYVDAYYNLHAVLLNQDDLEPATKYLRKVVKLQPQDHDARFMLGVLLEYRGNIKEAIDNLDIVAKTTALMRARIDAWNYIKSTKKMPKITGSGDQIFRLSLKKTNSKGLVLEFGVRFATSIRQIAKMVNQPIHGFDSFEGLPEVWHHEPKGSYTTKGIIPAVPDNVQLHVGWFENTLPKFLESHPDPIRFVNIDCDIYSSTVTILENLAPRMVIGSVIVFDEYICNKHWREDEFKALQEAVKKYSWEYEYIYFSVFTKQVAIRITKV